MNNEMNRRDFTTAITKLGIGAALGLGTLAGAEIRDLPERTKRANELKLSPQCEDKLPKDCLPDELQMQPKDIAVSVMGMGSIVVFFWGVADLVEDPQEAERKQRNEHQSKRVKTLSDLHSLVSTNQAEVQAVPVVFQDQPESWQFGVDVKLREGENLIGWSRVQVTKTHKNRISQLAIEQSRDSVQMLLTADRILESFKGHPSVKTSVVNRNGPMTEEELQLLHEQAAARWIEPLPIPE